MNLTFLLHLSYFNNCRLIGKSLWYDIFLYNTIQFGTDQLRDAPTRHSIVFLYVITGGVTALATC